MNPTARELDVRQVPPPQRHPEIFRTFDALAPGESFVLINDHDPKPLLYQFQAERAGTFDWNVLESGPVRFRIDIARRDSGTQRTVSDLLGQDHRRLDALLARVTALSSSGSFDEAAARFTEFRCGLDRHIDIEEQLLFPEFERATGAAAGPTEVMRMDHREIRTAMGVIAHLLGSQDASRITAAIQSLIDILSIHNMKEEHVLYPMTDQALGDPRSREDFVKRMQAL